jgi:hypothetical protein
VKSGLYRGSVWAIGVVFCLGYYAMKTARWTRITAVGRETPLFGRWNLEVTPFESDGGKWALTAEQALSRVQQFAGVTRPDPPGWPSSITSPRRVNLLQPSGTWAPEGDALRRLWRFRGTGWTGEQRLRGTVGSGETGVELDIRRGRTHWTPDGVRALNENMVWENDLYYDEDSEILGVLNDTLENGDENLAFSKQKHFKVGDRKLFLLWAPWEKGKRHPIVAASDETAPRVLRLADDGVPIELGKDGRTLWFSRGNVLWRLDLRKPLPELLDQAPLPKLPEPPLE